MSANSGPSKVILKNDIEKFLHKLTGEYAVFIPSKDKDVVTYKQFNRNSFLQIRYSNFDIPPAKGFLFPPLIKKYSEYPFEDAWMKPGKKLIYGVRPCDAQSLVLLDMAVKDSETYKEKRANVLLIVQGCDAPSKTCFCTSVNGGPFSTAGADIFMTDLGDRFVVEDISGKGREHLRFLTDAGSNDLVKKARTETRSLEMIENVLALKGISENLERLDKKFEKEGTWQRLGEHCINCSRCTSVCPTCHCCFVIEDVVDIVHDEIGDEAAKFDPCMLNIFLSNGLDGAVPGGHQRLQRRLMDKFCRTMKTVGQPFCVGCGRCVTNCTENVDITEILRFVINMEKKYCVDATTDNVHRVQI